MLNNNKFFSQICQDLPVTTTFISHLACISPRALWLFLDIVTSFIHANYESNQLLLYTPQIRVLFFQLEVEFMRKKNPNNYE